MHGRTGGLALTGWGGGGGGREGRREGGREKDIRIGSKPFLICWSLWLKVEEERGEMIIIVHVLGNVTQQSSSYTYMYIFSLTAPLSSCITNHSNCQFATKELAHVERACTIMHYTCTCIWHCTSSCKYKHTRTQLRMLYMYKCTCKDLCMGISKQGVCFKNVLLYM